MMTSWDGSDFHTTGSLWGGSVGPHKGPVWGESTGHQLIPPYKGPVMQGFEVYSISAQTNSQVAGDFRFYITHVA